MAKNKKSRLAKTIALHIIKNSFNASAWIFSTLIQLGELTLESFLSPSLYADPPSSFFESSHEIPKNKPDFKEKTIRQSIRRLEKQGFLERKDDKYILSKLGKKLAEYVKIRKKSIEKKWDGKYRVVIFDIPEKEKESRNWLRQELYLLDYQQLQKSVFISKHSLTKDLIKEIKSRKIGNGVNYLLVDKVYKNFLKKQK